MLSAATSRLRGATGRDAPSSSSLSPAERSNRRLSRLSPSEFDSILDSQQTKVLHTSGRDESQLGVAHDVPPSPDPASPQHSPDLSRTSPRGGRIALPPLLAPEPGSADAIKRRSMFRSGGNASSPDLSSLLKKAKEGSGRIGAVPAEEQEVLEDTGAREGAFDDADEGQLAPSSPPRPARSRSTTSPTLSRTGPRSPSATSPPTSHSQLSVPSSGGGTDSRDSTLASRASSSSNKPHLSSISTFSTGSYVHVPFPEQSALQGLAPPDAQAIMNGSNPSVTSLGQGIGFDFSPRRKRSNAGEGEDGKISLAGTMRKTSRFFRKFGGGGGSSAPTSYSKSTSTPTTPAEPTFSSSSTAPPVPPIPSSYSRSSNNAPSSPPTSRNPAPPARRPSEHRESSSIDISIRRPSAGAPGLGPSSHPLARDTSQNSLATTVSSGKSSKSARRRSLSLNSASLSSPAHALPVPPATVSAPAAPSASSSSSRGRRPSASPRTGEEDDQLRFELRQWRLGVDGVLGVGSGGSAGGTPSPRVSPAAANRAKLGSPDSSPTMQRRSPRLGASPAAASGMDRRPSLPEGKALPATPSAMDALQQRSASLPTASLFPVAPSLERSQSGPAATSPSLSPADSPSIRLTSPASISPSLSSPAHSPSATASATASPSSIRTLPALAPSRNLAAQAASSLLLHHPQQQQQQQNKRHSIAETEGIGLGVALEPIAEGLHSREGSAATATATPPVARSDADRLSPNKTPMRGGSEARAGAGGRSSGSETEGEGGAGSTPTAGRKTVPLPSVVAPSPVASVASANANANGGKSNQRVGVTRGSIVGYPALGGALRPGSSSAAAAGQKSLPGSLASSAAGSTASLPLASSASAAGGVRRKRQQTKGEDDGAALGEEELQEKARGLAKRAWDEDESFLERRKIAVWLGSAGRVNVAALRHYIDNFDFAGLRLDVAFRRLCNKLYLKAETQQVDRILEQFSRRFFEDNPKTVYGSAEVVHAVSYSLLLLNTDLHVVDTTTRMTRQQFIRNTIEAIKAQAGDSEVIQTPLAPALLFSSPNPSVAADDATDSNAVFGSPEASSSRKSLERPRTATSIKSTSARSATGSGAKDSPASSTLHLPASPVLSRSGTSAATDSPTKPPASSSGAATTPMRSESLLTVNSTISNKSLEANLQATLKDMYNAIKSQPIYQSAGGSSSASASALNLPGGEYSGGRPSLSLTPGNSPYATWSGGVNRSASKRSGATSTLSVGSGSSSYKRSSVRGMGALLGASSSLELARSSSPTPSTNTSLSDEHWSTAFGASQHHAVPTIGFANSLSHTIIREQQEDDAKSDRSSISVSSAELALLGAPWAKEGILHRKHYWETAGKRSKDKSWVQAFVVISAGELKMFKFDSSGGSRGGMGGLGGGDWTANASSVGAISLIHALCSAMPAPGYSKDRPHCFVLTLPNGGSYFFQAGTPDLVAEWVATCNYWSGRLSKEPLSGGVSNMEYGWNRAEPPSRDDDDDDEDDYEEIASIRSGHSRMSHAGSMFSSHGGGTGGNPNDRIHINDWKPPQVPLTPSNLPEEAQLDALKRHSDIVHKELAHHNTLRAPMTRLYSNRSSNGNKALANWERKSQHLLAETVKWTTYIDALSSAVRLRSIQRGKKEVEAMLESADAGDDEDDDELAASLSPYEQPPASIKVDAPPSPASPVDSKVDGNRQARFDSTASQVSVATATTGDEFFDSTADTPP
ncbi:hypothetical protein JCM6882_003942 [Rhodosporidiobolus microsporus]